jgi:hypothetical protein
MRKILVVTARFPFDLHGACEQDHAHSIVLLKKPGYEVEMVCMCFKRYLVMIESTSKDYGVDIFPVLYSHVDKTHFAKLLHFFKKNTQY